MGTGAAMGTASGTTVGGGTAAVGNSGAEA